MSTAFKILSWCVGIALGLILIVVFEASDLTAFQRFLVSTLLLGTSVAMFLVAINRRRTEKKE